jgi:hypothetical protein
MAEARKYKGCHEELLWSSYLSAGTYKFSCNKDVAFRV